MRCGMPKNMKFLFSWALIDGTVVVQNLHRWILLGEFEFEIKIANDCTPQPRPCFLVVLQPEKFWKQTDRRF